jgi:hypothetical protein
MRISMLATTVAIGLALGMATAMLYSLVYLSIQPDSLSAALPSAGTRSR